jgi:PAS domain S-box-containing protein
MIERPRILLSSILVMVAVSLSAAGVAIYALYDVAFEEQRARLNEVAMSRARIIEAVARFDAQFSRNYAPGGPRAATLRQVVEAHANFEGFGETGEFALAQRDGDSIVFLLRQRHGEGGAPRPIPPGSELAEPMRRALSGESGTLVGLDYRGERVLAAYQAVAELEWGVVAKIDIAEIRSPFLRAGLQAGGIALIVIAIGVWFVLRLTSPLMQRIETHTRELKEAHDRLEARVAERTSELSDANVSLRAEIDERERAQRALSEITARNTAILDAAVEGIITLDGEGVIESINPSAVRMFGYSRDELVGRNVDTLISTLEPDAQDDGQSDLSDAESRSASDTMREMTGRQKDGTSFPIEFSIAEVDLGLRRIFVGTIHNLTQRKQIEDQLLQAQKMEAIGQVAGGIAHDFNNLLATIQGSSELILDGKSGDERLLGAAERIHMATDRGAALTRKLLAFSRKQVIQPEVVSLNSLVTGVSKLFGRLIGEDVEIKLNLQGSLGSVKIDPSQFDQVVLNLAVNASDAMPTGGELTIATANVTLNKPQTERLGLEPGPYVSLAISDTGSGMAPEILSHIFEPFFTTKGPGKGTGLGLSTVYGIVKQSEGEIEVQSEPGCGTMFSIYLPRCDEEVREPPAPTDSDEREMGSETILLVEDDGLFRELTTEVLEMHGYNVVAAAFPEEAMHISDDRNGDIDMVITDMVMPQMTGVDLVAQLRLSHPEVRVLFMSGYTDVALAHRGVLDPDDAFIRKPFSNKALAAKIREVLDAPNG